MKCIGHVCPFKAPRRLRRLRCLRIMNWAVTARPVWLAGSQNREHGDGQGRNEEFHRAYLSAGRHAPPCRHPQVNALGERDVEGMGLIPAESEFIPEGVFGQSPRCTPYLGPSMSWIRSWFPASQLGRIADILRGITGIRCFCAEQAGKETGAAIKDWSSKRDYLHGIISRRATNRNGCCSVFTAFCCNKLCIIHLWFMWEKGTQ